MSSGPRPKQDLGRPEHPIPIRSRGPLRLVVDLETLAKGQSAEKGRLVDCLERRPHTSLVYAAQARSLASATVGIEVLHLPTADVIVADEGASLRAAHESPALDAVDAEIGERWPGTRDIRTRISALGHLVNEHRWEGSRRVTCFPRRDVQIEDAWFAVEKVLADLDVNVRITHDERIDVLPRGVDFTGTITNTLDALQVDPFSVVAAGAFVGPKLFAYRPYWGIATGDTPDSVRAALAHNPRVQITGAEGPQAVLNGLQTLGFL